MNELCGWLLMKKKEPNDVGLGYTGVENRKQNGDRERAFEHRKFPGPKRCVPAQTQQIILTTPGQGLCVRTVGQRRTAGSYRARRELPVESGCLTAAIQARGETNRCRARKDNELFCQHIQVPQPRRPPAC